MTRFALIGLLLAGLVSLPADANPVRRDHIDAELIPATTSVEPGSVLTVALRLKPDAHWHTYWKNPGDSGLATHIDWELPEGFSAGPILWPVPTRIDVGPLANYGYDGEVLLLTDIQVPRDLPASVPIRAMASWLVCEEICIPGDAEFTLALPVGPAKPNLLWSGRIDQTRAALPKTIDGLDVRAQFVAGSEWVLSLPRSVLPQKSTLRFFADSEERIDHASKQQMYEGDGMVYLRFAAASGASEQQRPLTGLLVADPAFASGATAALISPAVSITESAPAAVLTGPVLNKAVSNKPAQARLTTIVALAFAFIGGVILNLMPCVFPVVGIKVLTFVENSRSSPASLRAHGLLFALGVLASFWVVAGALLGLRAGGATLGWGYQLQSPLVISALALLFFVLALNMSGVFELGTRAQQLAGSVRANTGYADAFFSGVIATLVATPCTAPFMGAALGFAITQSAPVAMAVFTALALGMAMPYLVLSFSPKLVGYLPKPGQWMVSLKQALAFPLYLTVVWLVWVLGRQVGIDAVARFLVGMTAVAAALWIYGRWNRAHTLVARNSARAVAAVLVVAALIYAWPHPGAAQRATLAAESDHWKEWSPAAVTAAREQGRVVFVDFTAAWCVTCQVNKRLVLNKDAVQQRFRDRGIVTMVADWTNRDPQISAALDALGRSGVPVYVFYPGNGGEPILLPELLTESLVLDGIDEATRNIRTAINDD
ncbi:MAG: thioredoxin family protein [Burkholderiales bacterium]|jgi:thiol:disulfide interchange protein DsbD